MNQQHLYRGNTSALLWHCHYHLRTVKRPYCLRATPYSLDAYLKSDLFYKANIFYNRGTLKACTNGYKNFHALHRYWSILYNKNLSSLRLNWLQCIFTHATAPGSTATSALHAKSDSLPPHQPKRRVIAEKCNPILSSESGLKTRANPTFRTQK